MRVLSSELKVEARAHACIPFPHVDSLLGPGMTIPWRDEGVGMAAVPQDWAWMSGVRNPGIQPQALLSHCNLLKLG